MQLLRHSHWLRLAPGERPAVLGCLRWGGAKTLAPLPELAAQVPLHTVRAPCLDADAFEWLVCSPRAVTSGQSGGWHFAQDGDFLFACLPCADATGGLAQAGETAYRQAFALMAAQGYPRLWRVWNYLADIHGQNDGLERYRQFNSGRHQAFESHQSIEFGQVPAACALGVQSPGLSIALIASRHAYVQIENPRQVSAYRYPLDYGPRSPTFSRAIVGLHPTQQSLWISGTASIVGHESVHLNDVVAQTHEALNNVEMLLAQARQSVPACDHRLQELDCLVYIRQVADWPLVQAVMQARVGQCASLSFVQADICRAELLVEIEASCTPSSLPIS